MQRTEKEEEKKQRTQSTQLFCHPQTAITQIVAPVAVAMDSNNNNNNNSNNNNNPHHLQLHDHFHTKHQNPSLDPNTLTRLPLSNQTLPPSNK